MAGPKHGGGLALGTGTVSIILGAMIVILVAYLARTRQAPALESPHPTALVELPQAD